ncbi:polysaccharide biosynthesis tyrosine autokinase [bacterium]|nr:polysaccharide biosynthesis tyrosine autokinase [bacterium]
MQDAQVKQGLDAQAIISTILRHKLVVLSAFLIFTTIVTYYSVSKPTIYRSSSIMFFDNSSSNPMLDILDKNGSIPRIDFGYYEIIMTTDIFNVLLRQDLRTDLLKHRDAEYVESALESFQTSQITMKPYKEAAQFIEIAAVSYDSFLVQKLVTVATDLLKRRTAELDKEGLIKGIDFIDEQIELTKNNLEKTELALQALKKKTDMTSKDEEGPLNKIILMKDKLAELETQKQVRESNLNALNSQLDSIQRRMTGNAVKPENESKEESKLKSQIEELNARKVQIFERLGADAYENVEVKKIDQQISQLRDKYYALLSAVDSDGEKPIVGDLNELWKNVFGKKNNEEIELILLKGQARLYAGLIRNFELKNPNLLQDAIDITRLSRSKQVYEETLSSLIKQKENFSIQMYGTTGNLKIIDPAKPPIPIYNKVFTTIFIGAMVGLLIGVALAFGIEYLDTTIKSIETIAGITNIPIIGKIPPIPREDLAENANGVGQLTTKIFGKKIDDEDDDKNMIRKKAMISQLNARSFISERYRALRTNIQFANIDTPMRSILVGSSGPGEGKTTTAVNLAISFSDMGHKVCLVDTDLRKPKHHLLFEINESPGLTDVVLNNTDLSSVIQSSFVKNLSVITGGADAQNHTEIFSSMRMNFLMNELEKKFDMVIYDTPPILLLTDSIILASRVDGVVIVTKYGVTQKQYLQNAIASLNTVRANVIGIVLNEFMYEKKGYYEYAYDNYYVNSEANKSKVGNSI